MSKGRGTGTLPARPAQTSRPADHVTDHARPFPLDLSRTHAAHLVGVGGAGLKAVAELLGGLGWDVSGSDRADSPRLRAMRRGGLRVYRGGDVDGFARRPDLLVHSPAVPADDPERRQAAGMGVPQVDHVELLAGLMRSRTGIAVAGTHGKSTTAAVLGTLLTGCGASPSVAVGAELCGCGTSGRAGESDLLVVEACEYRRHFLKLSPTHAILTGVEPDHFDCYADAAELEAAFTEFTASLPAGGTLVVPHGCDVSRRAAANSAARVVTFGRGRDAGEAGADWWTSGVKPTATGSRFRLFRGDAYAGAFTLPVPGDHQVSDAAAAIVLCADLGIPVAALSEALWDFPGLRRRFEVVGSWRGRLLVDDYAHHPTAVAATIAAARTHLPGRRICVFFQPHQASRTEALHGRFAAALAGADAAAVLPVFAAREDVTDGRCAELSRDLAAAAGGTFCETVDRLIDAVDHRTRPGDVVLTLGAGDIDRVHHEFARRLRGRRQAG